MWSCEVVAMAAMLMVVVLETMMELAMAVLQVNDGVGGGYDRKV